MIKCVCLELNVVATAGEWDSYVSRNYKFSTKIVVIYLLRKQILQMKHNGTIEAGTTRLKNSTNSRP